MNNPLDLLRDLYEPNTPTKSLRALRRDVEALKRSGFVRRMVEDGSEGGGAVALESIASFPYFNAPHQMIGSDTAGQPFLFEIPQYGFVTRDKTGVLGAGAFNANSVLARTANAGLGVDDDVYVLNMPVGSVITRTRENGPVVGDDVVVPLTYRQFIEEVADAQEFDFGDTINLSFDGPYLYWTNDTTASAANFNLPSSGAANRAGVEWTILNLNRNFTASRKVVVVVAFDQNVNDGLGGVDFEVTGSNKLGCKIMKVAQIGSDERFVAYDFTDRNT